jgi:hypothetical protein
MTVDYQGYKLTKIVNPNPFCTQVVFESPEETDIRCKTLVLFEKQIKYMEIEEHQKFKRVKVYLRGDEEAIDLDFTEENMDQYDLFFRSMYNN